MQVLIQLRTVWQKYELAVQNAKYTHWGQFHYRAPDLSEDLLHFLESAT